MGISGKGHLVYMEGFVFSQLARFCLFVRYSNAVKRARAQSVKSGVFLVAIEIIYYYFTFWLARLVFSHD